MTQHLLCVSHLGDLMILVVPLGRSSAQHCKLVGAGQGLLYHSLAYLKTAQGEEA